MNQNPPAEWWQSDFVVESRDRSGSGNVGEAKVPDSDVPFWALMAFTFILLIAPQAFFPVLAPLRIGLITAAVAIATYLFDRFIQRQPIMSLTREMWITACLVGWAIVTVPLSYWPGGSVSVLLDLYFKTIAIFWLLSNVVNTPVRLRQVAWGLSLMAVPPAVTGIKNFFSGVFITEGVSHEVKRIVGYDGALTKNPNDLALILNLILPLTVALLLVARRPPVRILLLAAIILEVSAVILTFSRSGFLTLATIFAIYLWRLIKRAERGWAVGALAIALACIPLVPSGYWDRLNTITDIESDPTGSSQARWRDTMAAVSFLVANPIVGAGVGMNVLALNEVQGAFWMEVHNVYLEYGVDLGIPGLVLFLLLLVGCIRSAKFVQRSSAGLQAFRELFCLAEGIQISLIAFAVAGLFYPVAYHFYFYYIAGLAMAVRAAYEAESQKAALDPNRSSPQKPQIPYRPLEVRDGCASAQD